MPTARPSRVSFILPMICRAGEEGMSCAGAAAERQAAGHALSQIFVDVAQMRDHRLPHMQMVDLRQLEYQGRRDMRRLVRSLAAVEQSGLAVKIGDAFGADASALAVFGSGSALKPLGRFARRFAGQ